VKYNNRTGDRGLTVVRALLLAAAVVVVVVLGYRQFARMTEKRVPVWVTASQLVKGRPVALDDVKVTQLPPPSGVLVNRADIEGRTLLTDKSPGEPFFPTDLAPRPAKPALAATIPPGRLLATLRFESMDLPAKELAGGDRIDVLLAIPDGVHVVAHDAWVLGILTQKTPPGGGGDSGRILGVDISIPGAHTAKAEGSALVLGLHPEEVFSLAAAEATGKQLKLVLHADREVKANEVIDLRPEPTLPAAPPPELPAVELIHGSKTETVHVR
jgi:Flp pilus assembly protein CpaB